MMKLITIFDSTVIDNEQNAYGSKTPRTLHLNLITTVIILSKHGGGTVHTPTNKLATLDRNRIHDLLRDKGDWIALFVVCCFKLCYVTSNWTFLSVIYYDKTDDNRVSRLIWKWVTTGVSVHFWLPMSQNHKFLAQLNRARELVLLVLWNFCFLQKDLEISKNIFTTNHLCKDRDVCYYFNV